MQITLDTRGFRDDEISVHLITLITQFDLSNDFSYEVLESRSNLFKLEITHTSRSPLPLRTPEGIPRYEPDEQPVELETGIRLGGSPSLKGNEHSEETKQAIVHEKEETKRTLITSVASASTKIIASITGIYIAAIPVSQALEKATVVITIKGTERFTTIKIDKSLNEDDLLEKIKQVQDDIGEVTDVNFSYEKK